MHSFQCCILQNIDSIKNRLLWFACVISSLICNRKYMWFCNRTGPVRINRQSNLNPFILSETHCGAAAAVVAAGNRLCLVIKGTFWTFSLKEWKNENRYRRFSIMRFDAKLTKAAPSAFVSRLRGNALNVKRSHHLLWGSSEQESQCCRAVYL